ncbi:MAG: hypothetical protein AAFO95_03820 [Cyanobacteria bacterium J06600_6]
MRLTEDTLGSASLSIKRFCWILDPERCLLSWSQPPGCYIRPGNSIEYLPFGGGNRDQSWLSVSSHQLPNLREEQ